MVLANIQGKQNYNEDVQNSIFFTITENIIDNSIKHCKSKGLPTHEVRGYLRITAFFLTISTHLFITCRSIIKHRYFSFWYYKKVHRRLWTNIVKSEAFIIFVYYISFNLFLYNLFKNSYFCSFRSFGFFYFVTHLQHKFTD